MTEICKCGHRLEGHFYEGDVCLQGRCSCKKFKVEEINPELKDYGYPKK